MSTASPPLRLRPLDPQAPAADAEIALVAERMRQTLVEVEGQARGGALYTLDWLRERVRWHLDPARRAACVWLAESLADAARPQIVGHAIVRVEPDAQGRPSGLFSTFYVVPEARRHGVADALRRQGENWMRARGLCTAATWTSATNRPLIALLSRHGYAVVEQGPNDLTGTTMVRLARTLD